MYFYRGEGKLGGAVIMKESIGENGVQSVVAFHWLGCHSLSLAGSLLGEGNTSSPCWGSRVENIFLLGMQGSSLPIWGNGRMSGRG